MSDPQSEFVERYAERGPRGARGEQGEQGPPTSPRLRRAIAALIAVLFALEAGNILFTAQYVNRTRAAQRAQGVVVERKICATLGSLAELHPPAGDPVANPSRAYLQGLHAKFTELGADLGCGG